MLEEVLIKKKIISPVAEKKTWLKPVSIGK
jgi:hypothetical protein